MAHLERSYFLSNELALNQRNQKPINEECFRQLYLYEPPKAESLSEKLKEILKFNKKSLFKIFPILRWLPSYKKENFMSDVIAGFTIAIMHIPQGMAYALLGGVPPVVGIYMAFFPVLVYIILGTSHHVSMGTFAVICMMVGKSVDAYTRLPESNSTDVNHDIAPLNSVEVATAVCFMVGIWQVVLSLLRLGCLSVLFSQTLVSGFTTGAAVHVFTSQVRNLIGVNIKRHSGPFKIIYTYIDIFTNLAKVNVTATILSICFIVFLVIFNELIKPYFQKMCKKNIPIPIELIVVVIGTLLSQQLHLKESFGIAIVDSVPTGLPNLATPPFYLLPKLVVDGLVIAIVAISINISMASIFAQKLNYEIDGNQEIFASGVGNIFAAFFSCMPFAASLSRSLIQVSVGGKTQLASVISCVSLLFVLLFIGPFFEPLPYCVLSTIIIVALKGMFLQIIEVPQIYKNSKLDGFVWLISFLSVVILDIDYGLGIGLMASLATLILQNQKSDVVVLGQIPNTHFYVDISRFNKAQLVHNVLILQLIGSLHFANSSLVKKEVMKLFTQFYNKFPIPLPLLECKKHKKQMFLVIDLSCVPSMDPSAIKTLNAIFDDILSFESNLLISGCQPKVYESLEKSQFFQSFSKHLIFHSLHDAVDYARQIIILWNSHDQIEFIPKF